MEIKKYLFKEINLDRLNNKWLIFTLKIASYVGLSAYLLSISWQAWPDIIVDFGQELYIPWRILEGDVLYRDIDFFHLGGPISLYWNALWFYLFGTSLNTIIAANIASLVLLVFIMESWLRKIGNQFSAFIAIMFFLAVFTFNRYLLGGNYNYITPYSITLVHGLIIILATLLSVTKWVNTNRTIWLWLSGLLLGLAILNKIEIAIAGIITTATYLISYFYINAKKIPNISKKHLFILPIATLIAPVITTLLFTIAMPLNKAAYNIFNQWVMLWDGRLFEFNNLLLYKHGLGADNILGNILQLMGWGWIYLNIILLGIFIVLILKPIKHFQLSIYIAIVVTTSSLGYFFTTIEAWLKVTRPLPLLMAIGFIFYLYFILKQRNKLENEMWPLRLASFALAEILLLKMILNVHIYHYGFVLAMPATLILVVTLIDWIPKYLDRYGNGSSFKPFIIGLLIMASFSYIKLSNEIYSNNNFLCCDEQGIEKIRTDSLRGPIIAKTLKKLEDILQPNQTFTVLPEGTMLNYLLRHKNSTPYFQFMPQLFIMYKERDVINSVAQNPPDFFVIVHRNTSDYGLRFFGKDYGTELYEWVNQNYKTIWQAGRPPLEPETDFGIIIAKKIKNKNLKN